LDGQLTKLLLDTHTFIWWDSEPTRLSARALELCQDPENRLILSVASLWEMQIKLQLGKLRLTLPLRETIKSQQQTNQVEVLPITMPHVFALGNLPLPHKDPFDRLLIAQAIVEDATIVTGDRMFSEYPINVVW
jgi:PIN domain nuclease of toxin-antitoxin system